MRIYQDNKDWEVINFTLNIILTQGTQDVDRKAMTSSRL